MKLVLISVLYHCKDSIEDCWRWLRSWFSELGRTEFKLPHLRLKSSVWLLRAFYLIVAAFEQLWKVYISSSEETSFANRCDDIWKRRTTVWSPMNVSTRSVVAAGELAVVGGTKVCCPSRIAMPANVLFNAFCTLFLFFLCNFCIFNRPKQSFECSWHAHVLRHFLVCLTNRQHQIL